MTETTLTDALTTVKAAQDEKKAEILAAFKSAYTSVQSLQSLLTDEVFMGNVPSGCEQINVAVTNFNMYASLVK